MDIIFADRKLEKYANDFSLEQPSRLIYKPIIPDELAQTEEKIDLVQLVELSVIEITDYHDKKIKR